MTYILIADDIFSVKLEEVFKTYEKNIPDLTIINFDDLKKASAMTEEIMIYDDTACVLALTSIMGDHEREIMYKSGVRAVIPSLDIIQNKDIRTVMNSILSVCNDLKNKECAGCWLSKKFTNLFEITIPNSE